MKWKFIVLCSLPLMIASFAAFSNESSLKPSVNSQQQNNITAAKYPTETSEHPFVVKNLEAEKTHERIEQDRPEQEEHSANEGKLAEWTIVLGVATICLALIAAAQFIMFYRQLGLMIDGAEDTRKIANAAQLNAKNSAKAVEVMQANANTQLRAFVFPVNIFSLWEKIPDTNLYGWRFRPRWENSGVTPTKNLIIHAWGELRETQLPADFDFNYPTDDTAPALIPPRLTLNGGIVPQNPHAHITPQDILDIQSGKKIFFMWGWAKYNDVFSGTPQHISRFCWMITPTGNPLLFNPGSTNPEEQLSFPYVYATYGNCADEECG